MADKEKTEGREAVNLEIGIVIRELERIRNSTSLEKERLIAAHPNWDSEKDARITSFSKFINVLNSTQLAFVFISRNLPNNGWWQDISKEPVSTSDRLAYTREFQNFVKLGFVQFSFSSIESAFRIFLRAIDPGACSGGIASFKSIYECLLRSNLSSAPAGAVELLDVLRHVRNTVHNNGVYFDRGGMNAQAIYKGVTYHFRHGQPVDFVHWGLLLTLTDDVRQLLVQVVSDKAIAGIAGQITDPFADP